MRGSPHHKGCGDQQSEVKTLEENITVMHEDNTKDTAKRENENKQAAAKLHALQQKNTKLQEVISRFFKDKAVRDTEDEKAGKEAKREQDRKVESKLEFICLLFLNTFGVCAPC